MNWFTRVQLPDRFKDMKPEEIERAFADFEAAQASQHSAPPPEKVEDSEAYKKLQDDLAAAQENLRKLQEAPPPNAAPLSNAAPSRISFLEDEDAAFAQRVGPLVNQTFQQGAVMARQIARQELAEATDPFELASNKYVLANYTKEVDNLFEAMAPQVRTNPIAYKNVVGVVKDRHFSDVVKAISANKALFESAASGGGRPEGQAAPGPEKELSAGELRAARKFGITPAEYLKAKSGLRIGTENSGYAEVKI